MRAAELGREWSVRVEHVERVKWYAPRIRHLVADVRCVPARLTSAWALRRRRVHLDVPRGDARRIATPIDFPRRAAARFRAHARVSLESPDPSLAEGTGRSPRPSRNAGRGAFAGASETKKSVRRMHRPTRATFADGPASAREPCVLTGLDLGPAPWTWSPEHLAAKPGVASTEVSVHVSASPHLDFVRKNFAFENVAFGEFLSRLRDEGPGPGKETGKETGTSWYYLRSIGANPRKEPAHALAQFPELAAELRVPGDVLWGSSLPAARLTEDARYFSAVLRCSSGGTRLWTHYDAMDNALIQLHGEKRVLLFPPRVSAGLYLEGSSSPVVGWEVDGERDGRRENRRGVPGVPRRARGARGLLQPGDVLFIPALWAHHGGHARPVRRGERALARAPEEARTRQKDLYGNAVPRAAGAEACAVEAAARRSPRCANTRVFYGAWPRPRSAADLRVERTSRRRCPFGASEEDGGDRGEHGSRGAEARSATPARERPENSWAISRFRGRCRRRERAWRGAASRLRVQSRRRVVAAPADVRTFPRARDTIPM